MIEKGEKKRKLNDGEDRDERDGGFVKWLSELSKRDGSIAGGKGANLGEIYNVGIPVPPAFVVTAQAYSYFIEKAGLKKEIDNIIKQIDIDDVDSLEENAKRIREMIENAEMPAEMQEEILEAYETLSIDKEAIKNAKGDALSILKRAYEPVFVAVRSSATTEDLKTASFAGQQETFLNIKGNLALIEAIKRCFASLFTARAIYYREKKGFPHEKSLIAVIIQEMIDANKSGVVFSKDPIKKTDNIFIEAVFGLGEGIVSGRILPDHYVVSRNLEIIDKKIADKKIAIIRDSSGETKQVRLTEEKASQQVLNEYELKKLADYALKLEEHYKIPQDIEFAISDSVYIVQTRPITTLETRTREKEKASIEGIAILKGLAASPGVTSGKVKIVHDLSDLSKVKKGDILVTKMTNPDMVVTMQKSAAILTDEGGLTAHASIVSREMGIPAVVGTRRATSLLRDGMFVTVNGFTGKVYEGRLSERIEKEILPVVNTETEIKTIIDLPSFAERAVKSGVSSVGLVRIEGIIAESGKHPLAFLNENDMKAYSQLIFKGLKKIAEHFKGLWVRTSDIRSDEYRSLEGAPEQEEKNPMLGMHGIRAGLKEPDILKAELLAIKKLAEAYPEKNVGIMLPQIIGIEELKRVKEMLNKLSVSGNLDSNLKIGVMIETPAAVQIIESLCREGIDFISFGTNDLTQYTLAVDRGNEDVQYLYDEMHPAILSQLAYVIKVCKEHGVKTSICGQAGSRKKMVGFLVKNGIDSISVNADAAHEISKFVNELETKLKTELEIGQQPDNMKLTKEGKTGEPLVKKWTMEEPKSIKSEQPEQRDMQEELDLDGEIDTEMFDLQDVGEKKDKQEIKEEKEKQEQEKEEKPEKAEEEKEPEIEKTFFF